jgi:hypothetical protein
MATGWAVPENPESSILWVEPVATIWYHISGVMAAVQVPAWTDNVAAVNTAVEDDVQACPPLTVNVLAEAHSSFAGGSSFETGLFSLCRTVPAAAGAYCKIRDRQHNKVMFFIGWYLFLKIC